MPWNDPGTPAERLKEGTPLKPTTPSDLPAEKRGRALRVTVIDRQTVLRFLALGMLLPWVVLAAEVALGDHSCHGCGNAAIEVRQCRSLRRLLEQNCERGRTQSP